VRELLEIWARTRDPRVGTLIERLSPRGLPISAGTRAVLETRWLELASKHEPRDLPALLATAMPARWAEALRRLLALSLWPPDPRLATFFTQLAVENPHQTVASMPYHDRLYELLAATGDPRVAARLKVAAPAPLPRLDELRWRAIQAIDRLPPEPLGPDELNLVTRVEAEQAERPDAGALLREVLAHPADDGPRAVLGDFLVEQEDPRGELIQLQLARSEGRDTPATRRREKYLLTQFGARWLGTLAVAVSDDRQRWERGFLAACHVVPNHTAGLVGDEGWATVEEIDFAPHLAHLPELLQHPVMRSLRAVHHTTFEAVKPLLEAGRLRAVTSEPRPEFLEACADARVPKVGLILAWAIDRANLARSRVLDTAEEIEVLSHDESLAGFLTLAQPHGVRRLKVTAAPQRWHADAVRSGDGWDVTYRWPGKDGLPYIMNLRRLTGLFDALPEALVRRLTVAAPPAEAAYPALRERAQRFTKLEELVLP
jgi:uncharacterized protein (TIGR02996 family)